MANDKKQILLRLDDGVEDELNYLCEVLEMPSKTALMNWLIRTQYAQFKNDPVISEKLALIKQMQNWLLKGQALLDDAGVPR